jgi:hypothetical protein
VTTSSWTVTNDGTSRSLITTREPCVTSKLLSVREPIAARAAPATQTITLASTTDFTTRERCARRSLRTAFRTVEERSGDAVGSAHVPNDPALSTTLAADGAGGGAATTGGSGTCGASGAGVGAGQMLGGLAPAGAADFSSGIVKGFGLIDAMVSTA